MQPTSRTKAEAMERPKPGDRWKSGATQRRIQWFDGVEVSYRFKDGRYRSQTSEEIESFRRWCAVAEYMGGAE